MVSRCGKAPWPNLIYIRPFQTIRDTKFQSESFMLHYPHLSNNGDILLILEDHVLFRLKVAIYQLAIASLLVRCSSLGQSTFLPSYGNSDDIPLPEPS